MDIVGKPCNLKVENFLDKMAQRFAAALFIQKMWRGFKSRLKLADIRIKKAKKAGMQSKGARIMFEVLCQLWERASSRHKCADPFLSL